MQHPSKRTGECWCLVSLTLLADTHTLFVYPKTALNEHTRTFSHYEPIEQHIRTFDLLLLKASSIVPCSSADAKKDKGSPLF
jgi:hypothetical protein